MNETKTLYMSYPYGSAGYSNSSYKTGNVVTRQRVRTWSRTSMFKNKWKGIELSPTPYEDSITERKLGISQVTLWRPDFPPTFPQIRYWGVFGFEDPSQVTLPTSENLVLGTKALGKIRSRINGTQFNLPLFMVEWRKTSDMVTALAQDIANKLKSAQSRRQLQNMWLEYRYGWRLLVMDIYSALCAVHDRRLHKSIMTVHAEATSQSRDLRNQSELVGTRYMVTGLKSQYSRLSEFEFGTRYAIRFRESSGVLGSLQQFGITNPIGLAWELIPYSFVIDWLIPVSDYLSTMDTWVGKEFVSGTVSYYVDTKYTCKPFGLRDGLNPAWIEKSGSMYAPSVIHRRFYKRTVLATFPTAALPSVQLALNASRMIDAVSLMLQRRRS